MSSIGPLDAVTDAISDGEYLRAFDLCSSIAVDDRAALTRVEATRLAYYRALALARSGSRHQAQDELAEVMAATQDRELPPDLAEDLLALEARLAKDEALAIGGEERARAAGLAAQRYEAVYRRLGRPFACINAATLFVLGGDRERGRSLASDALRLLDADVAVSEAASYWSMATRAEAAAILGDRAMLLAALSEAAHLLPGDRGARATTVRQLTELFGTLELDASLLDELRNPGVVHYCGHRPSTEARGLRVDDIDRVAALIAGFFDERRIGAVHGSLASGADILIAEEAMRRDIELHVVLPFATDEFVEVSVASSGADWDRRFHRCLDAASSVTIACDSSYLGDDVLYGYAAAIAMGSAVNRARAWAAPSEQLAVWDRSTDAGRAGTGHDVRRWSESGRPTTIIDVASPAATAAVPQASDGLGRTIRPILFADVKGFSRLADEHMSGFLEGVMRPIGRVLAEHGDAVLMANTWGDGVKAVVTDVATAAAIALGVQEAMAAVDLAARGLPDDMGLRVSAHVGPVMEVADPVTGMRDYTGRELTRAARIEPRTPVGSVYVTAAFAALLALAPNAPAVPEYVGTITTAKDFETIPMFVLRPTQ